MRHSRTLALLLTLSVVFSGGSYRLKRTGEHDVTADSHPEIEDGDAGSLMAMGQAAVHSSTCKVRRSPCKRNSECCSGCCSKLTGSGICESSLARWMCGSTQRFSLQQAGQGTGYPAYKKTKRGNCRDNVSPGDYYMDIKAESYNSDDNVAIARCRTAAQSLGLSSSRVYKTSRANRPCGCYYVPSASKKKLFYNKRYNPYSSKEGNCWKTPATSKRQQLCALDPNWENIGA